MFTFPVLDALVNLVRSQILGHLVEYDHRAIVGAHVSIHASTSRRGGLCRSKPARKQLGKPLGANGLALAAIGANYKHKALLSIHFKRLQVHFVDDESVSPCNERILGENHAKPLLQLVPNLPVACRDLLAFAIRRKGHARTPSILSNVCKQLPLHRLVSGGECSAIVSRVEALVQAAKVVLSQVAFHIVQASAHVVLLLGKLFELLVLGLHTSLLQEGASIFNAALSLNKPRVYDFSVDATRLDGDAIGHLVDFDTKRTFRVSFEHLGIRACQR